MYSDRGGGVIPRIARRGIEPGERLGRHRWKIKPTLARLLGYRRLTIRYEGEYPFTAFLTLTAALICYKNLAQITT